MKQHLRMWLLAMVCLPWYGISQSVPSTINSVLHGRVTDAKRGVPLEGVSISIKNTTHNVLTGPDGRFNFRTGQKLPYTLVVSNIGYKTLTLTVETEDVAIQLEEAAGQLDDVVVTGVAEGTSRKKLSFALTKVSTEQLNTVPATDASQSLRGKVAGLQIDQAAGNAGATVYLRGAKSINGNIAPLLVIDGFVTALSLADLNPQDIESIEVVKGAAASALYGTRGEGGVIQVITKKGKGLNRISITVDNEYGVSNVQRTPPTSQYHFYKVNADGSFVLSSGNNRTLDLQSNGFSLNQHRYTKYNDNVGNMLSNNPYYTNFVSLSTAGDKYSLYISFQNQSKGSVAGPIASDTRRTALLNIGYKPVKNLEAEVTVQYFNTNTPSASLASSGAGSVLYSALLYEPFIDLTERQADGRYAFKPYGFDIQKFNVGNPFYQLSYREYARSNNNYLVGGKLRYRFSQKFSAELNGSFQNEYGEAEDYYPVGYQTLTPEINRNNGYYGLSNSRVSSKNGQIQLNYNDRAGDFDFGVNLKSVYEETLVKDLSASGYNLSAPVKSLDVVEAATRSSSSSWSQLVNYGYFLNLKSVWKNKVFLDVLGRIDLSSRFGADVGAAFFPRASVAYRVTEDVHLGAVTDLKLRAAYGKAGSLPGFGAKESRVTLTSSGGVSYTRKDNTDLTRAVTSELEVGFDAVLFKRINIQANYARATSKNDFILVPAFPPTSGTAGIWDNLGEVKSSSVELEINGNLVNRGKFSWNAGATFSRVRSKITSLGDVPEFTSGDFRKAAGISPYSYYGYSILTSLSQLETDKNGFVSNAAGGTLRPEYFAVNKLGFVVLKSQQGTAAEAPVFYQNAATGNNKVIGDAQADFLVGFTNTLTWGPLSLYTVLDWKQGGQKYNETVNYLTYQYRSVFTDKAVAAGLPLPFVTGVFNAQQTTDYWLENSGYVALREVSLGWQLPVQKLRVASVVKGAKLSFIARNLYTWTNFTGVTPEGWDIDFYAYPTFRTFSGRLTLNF
ncbi:TonB-linked SusC/RagA family outer membrane protein [Filimonas zeae]|uniref:SusC/RagA family TonB-linked outer membrane protein n=1 Tax=Filimonas zeae TaxID=1737353 RepID=A0A917J323_9BACT|nr:SusC/RagA family TonB-linked outer membrane protein [Filimonas zeae]MDR6340558.1 TonB-linked SusC/RagA family outer membrane protein [Filimonas zeae]GGH73295.1 SusC/RagA family TonB-linked outer membrane protein [Filimonas zeae]